MRPESLDLDRFYASHRGAVARTLIGRRLRSMLPSGRNLCVLGLGYPAPFIQAFRGVAERMVVLNPREQGSSPWNSTTGRASCVVQETALPLPDRSVDVVLLAHALEASDRANRLLREIWRVLDDAGELLVIVPNRRGVWCLAELTPFGFGRPYSASQLKDTLRTNLFEPLEQHHALYVPPFRSPMWLRTATAWERAGRHIATGLSGVIIAKAAKSMICGTPLVTRESYAGRKVLAMPLRSGVAARDGKASVAARDEDRHSAQLIAFNTRQRRT